MVSNKGLRLVNVYNAPIRVWKSHKRDQKIMAFLKSIQTHQNAASIEYKKQSRRLLTQISSFASTLCIAPLRSACLFLNLSEQLLVRANGGDDDHEPMEAVSFRGGSSSRVDYHVIFADVGKEFPRGTSSDLFFDNRVG